MQKEITDIRRATHSDLAAISELNQRLYDVKRSEQFFSWYFFDAAFDGELYCAYDGDTLAGTLGIHSRELNKNLKCCQIVSINVAPEYAGKGAIISLVLHISDVLEKFDIICMFANNNALIPCRYYFRMNFEELHTLVKELPGQTDFKGLFEATLVSQETRFINLLDDGGCISFYHSEEFRRWRFGRHPMHQYVKIECPDGDFAIVKTFTDRANGLIYGDIVDLECPLSQERRVKHLLRASCQYFRYQKVSKVTMWATPNSRLQTFAMQCDFRVGTTVTNWGINVQNKDIGDIYYSISNWHISQCDSSNY